MAETVLIIDPEELERRRLHHAFAVAGLEVIEAGSAIEGLFETLERDPNLILLAEEVPPLEAGDLLLVLRRITTSPVIVIGSGGEPDEVVTLDLGADFYLRRPFSGRELIARARALLRRHRASARNRGRSDFAGPAALTTTDKRVLACLIAHRGQPVTLSDVIAESYGGTVSKTAAKVALWRLRQKLTDGGLRLVTHPRVGYRLMRDGLADTGQAAG